MDKVIFPNGNLADAISNVHKWSLPSSPFPTVGIIEVSHALTLVVILVYISNSFSSRSVSLRKRRPM